MHFVDVYGNLIATRLRESGLPQLWNAARLD